MTNPLLDIRIGTMVPGNDNTANYIRQIKRHGFESFEINFWRTIGKIDLGQLAREVRAAIGTDDIRISALGIYGNPLESGRDDRQTLADWKRCIDQAHLFGAPVVAGFAGRLRNRPVNESMKQFKKVFGPLAKRAADRGLKIAFENCDMGGTWETGDFNIAHAPRAWAMMFHEVPAANLGLEWEPCHQLVSFIDPIAQLRQWAPRVFHLHGKDATVMWDVIRREGIRSGQPCVHHRTPGFGDTNWSDVITILRQATFQGAIDIEGWHDPVYRGDLEMTGQVRGLRYLQECRGGTTFVPNPA
ncbi:sugar phosphate isomerase/epimerase [bacterium]|nr:sugar phosphate isomerase/epimerase [bacterium]